MSAQSQKYLLFGTDSEGGVSTKILIAIDFLAWLEVGDLNPNPGGLVANMTSKTQNCCDKFIIYKKKLKKI